MIQFWAAAWHKAGWEARWRFCAFTRYGGNQFMASRRLSITGENKPLKLRSL
jgi:hypothetical protein